MLVSLVAVAALAASLTVVKQRSEERRPDSLPEPGQTPSELDFDLDQIRAAGL